MIFFIKTYLNMNHIFLTSIKIHNKFDEIIFNNYSKKLINTSHVLKGHNEILNIIKSKNERTY